MENLNEPKPEDVVRALECCERRNCGMCHYKSKCGDACVLYLCGDAIALLREKDARIKELEESQGAEFTCFVGEPHKVDHCPYGDEIVRLQKEVAEKDAEIERLQGALKAEERHNELTMECAKKALANARAETERKKVSHD